MKFPKPAEDPFGDSISVVQDVTTPRSPRTEADQLRDLLTNSQMPDNAVMSVTLGELRAAFSEAEAAAPRSGEGLEKAARAWVAEHRNGRKCTIVDCPTATALRAAVDATEVST